ncbi:MAG TPA: helical backbone metal receptor [Gemmatimonadaceae bacterium]|nr:helical backbone metal receptor [Gemmatimonadaceae bacterium]
MFLRRTPIRPFVPFPDARAALAILIAAGAGCAATACGAGARPPIAARGFVDDFGDTIAYGPAQRIVSLNPVTTELLFAAGLGSRVVGRTHWDHYPPAADAVPDLGDGIGPNVELVVGARPDLVLLYAGGSNQRAAASLRAAGVRTLAVRTDHIADLARVAAAFAAVTGDSATVRAADTALATVDSVRHLPRPARPLTVVWHMGEPPLYVAGSGSFMGELIEVAGGTNVFADVAAPSPQVSVEEVSRRDPDVILAGPETARRLPQSAAWRTVRAVREGHLAVYDTVLVGRPGVRIGEAALDVRRLLFPHAARPQ